MKIAVKVTRHCEAQPELITVSVCGAEAITRLFVNTKLCDK